MILCFFFVNFSGFGFMFFEEFLEVMFGICFGCVFEEILVVVDLVLVYEVF